MADKENTNDPCFINSFVCKKAKGERTSFVITQIGIKIEDALEEIAELAKSEHCSKGWLNIEIKESKNGNIYAQHNTWTPTKKDETDDERIKRLTAELKEAKAAKKSAA